MSSSKTRLDREKKTIKTMINMYCKKIHDTSVANIKLFASTSLEINTISYL